MNQSHQKLAYALYEYSQSFATKREFEQKIKLPFPLRIKGSWRSNPKQKKDSYFLCVATIALGGICANRQFDKNVVFQRHLHKLLYKTHPKHKKLQLTSLNLYQLHLIDVADLSISTMLTYLKEHKIPYDAKQKPNKNELQVLVNSHHSMDTPEVVYKYALKLSKHDTILHPTISQLISKRNKISNRDIQQLDSIIKQIKPELLKLSKSTKISDKDRETLQTILASYKPIEIRLPKSKQKIGQTILKTLNLDRLTK